MISKITKALAALLASLLLIAPVAAAGDLLVFKNSELEDDEVAPGSVLEVVFDLENPTGKDYKDVVVTAQIEGDDDTKVTKEFGTIASGNTREEKKMFVTVPDDLRDGSHNVLLKAKGKLYGVGTKTAQIKVPFTVEQRDSSLYVKSVDFSTSNLIAGTSVDLAVKLVNNGREDLDDVRLLVELPELNARQSLRIGDVAQDNEKVVYLTLDVPESAASGIYALRVSASNKDANAVRSQDVEVTKVAPRIVETRQNAVTPSTVSTPAIKLGKGAVVSLDVRNNQNARQAFSIVLGGVADWTTSARADPTTFTLDAGDSETVQVYLLPKETGDKSFTLYVKSGAELVSAVQVNVKVSGGTAAATVSNSLFPTPKMNASWLFAGFVVLVALVAGVWFYNKGDGQRRLGPVYY